MTICLAQSQGLETNQKRKSGPFIYWARIVCLVASAVFSVVTSLTSEILSLLLSSDARCTTFSRICLCISVAYSDFPSTGLSLLVSSTGLLYSTQLWGARCEKPIEASVSNQELCYQSRLPFKCM